MTASSTSGISEVIGDKRAEVLRIAAQHGAHNVRVIGSVARGEAGPESDVDILIEAGPKTSSWFPGGLIADLEELLGRPVDVATDDSLHWYIRNRVLAEAIPLDKSHEEVS